VIAGIAGLATIPSAADQVAVFYGRPWLSDDWRTLTDALSIGGAGIDIAYGIYKLAPKLAKTVKKTANKMAAKLANKSRQMMLPSRDEILTDLNRMQRDVNAPARTRPPAKHEIHETPPDDEALESMQRLFYQNQGQLRTSILSLQRSVYSASNGGLAHLLKVKEQLNNRIGGLSDQAERLNRAYVATGRQSMIPIKAAPKPGFVNRLVSWIFNSNGAQTAQ
jgi:hypothetical protein